jgi:hypothetical protein
MDGLGVRNWLAGGEGVVAGDATGAGAPEPHPTKRRGSTNEIVRVRMAGRFTGRSSRGHCC